MRHFIGLDVSMKETSVCIVDEQGRVVRESREKTCPLQLASAIKKAGLSVEKIGIESGSLSHWLVTQLQKLDLPAICIDSRQMGALLALKINKTDKNDARVIANAMRTMTYQEVKLKSQKDIELSTLLTARATLVSQRTTLKNTIRGMLKSYGIRLKTVGKKTFIVAVKTAIQDQCSIVQEGIEAVLAIYEVVDAKIIPLEKRLVAIAEEDEDAKLLMTIPGVGAITALNFKVTIGDPERFKDSRNVGAYVGMTPRQYSSGEVERQGRISKCGCKQTRSLLVAAATVMLIRTKSWSKLKAWGLKIYRKKGMKKAAVAVGRKLAVIMHRMMKTREAYRLTDEVTEKKAA